MNVKDFRWEKYRFLFLLDKRSKAFVFVKSKKIYEDIRFSLSSFLKAADGESEWNIGVDVRTFASIFIVMTTNFMNQLWFVFLKYLQTAYRF